MKLSQILIILFVLVGVCDVIMASGYGPPLRHITKPLLMPLLAAYFYCITKNANDQKSVKLMLLALIFAWGGDTFLMFEDYFLYGLVSFLIMQLLYVVVFVRGANFMGRREMMYGLGLIVVMLLVNIYIKDYVGDFMIAVIFYTLAIGTMSFAAYTRDYRYKGYWSVVTGTLFFVISDSLLSINMFRDSIPAEGILIMGTYLIAQYLIAEGMARHLNAD